MLCFCYTRVIEATGMRPKSSTKALGVHTICRLEVARMVKECSGYSEKIQPDWVVESKLQQQEGWLGEHTKVMLVADRAATASAPPCRRKCCMKPV